MDFKTILLMSQPDGGGGWVNLLFLAAIFLVMYFFMIRPQQKKAKEQRGFLSELKKGDHLVTIGGVHGKVIRVDDTSVLLEVDKDTKLRIEKAAISLEYTKAQNKNK